MLKMVKMAALGVALASTGVMANELDPVAPAEAPQGLIVRVSPDGKREVFESTLKEGVVTSDAQAAATVETDVKAENEVLEVTPGNELDQVTSDNSWRWYWGSGRYSYGYHCGPRSYSYYPSYSYSYRGYSYSYYYTSYYYSYNYSRGYNWYDSYGYHRRSGHRW